GLCSKGSMYYLRCLPGLLIICLCCRSCSLPDILSLVHPFCGYGFRFLDYYWLLASFLDRFCHVCHGGCMPFRLLPLDFCRGLFFRPTYCFSVCLYLSTLFLCTGV